MLENFPQKVILYQIFIFFLKENKESDEIFGNISSEKMKFSRNKQINK
jgi:hypothetical protein